MNVSLTAELERFVRDRIRSGLSTTMSRAIFDASCMMHNSGCNANCGGEEMCRLLSGERAVVDAGLGGGWQEADSGAIDLPADVEPVF